MQLRFVSKKQEVPGVFSLSFEPLHPVKWVAGQSVRLEVPGFYGSEERRFTISAAPSEKYLTITTRLGPSSYKQILAALEPGAEVRAYDIRGDFTWSETPLRRLFVASGIGLTPFFSMLKQRMHDSLPLSATVLHASRDLGELFPEIESWQVNHPELSLQRFNGERISADLITRHVSELEKYVVFLSGQSDMVDEVGYDLIKHKGLPEAQLKRDWFTGRLGRDD